MPTVTISFPVKQESGHMWPYPTFHLAPFLFSFEVELAPQTKQGALLAAAWYRERFCAETSAQGISTSMLPLQDYAGVSPPWIPACYLHECILADVDGVPLQV